MKDQILFLLLLLLTGCSGNSQWEHYSVKNTRVNNHYNTRLFTYSEPVLEYLGGKWLGYYTGENIFSRDSLKGELKDAFESISSIEVYYQENLLVHTSTQSTQRYPYQWKKEFITKDMKGNIWLVGEILKTKNVGVGKFIAQFINGKWSVGGYYLPEVYHSGNAQKVVVDSDRTVWISYKDNLLAISSKTENNNYYGEQGKANTLKTLPSLKTNKISGIFSDLDGRVWITTPNEVVRVTNGQLEDMSYLFKDKKLPVAIGADKNGRILFSSTALPNNFSNPHSGVSRLNYRPESPIGLKSQGIYIVDSNLICIDMSDRVDGLTSNNISRVYSVNDTLYFVYTGAYDFRRGILLEWGIGKRISDGRWYFSPLDTTPLDENFNNEWCRSGYDLNELREVGAPSDNVWKTICPTDSTLIKPNTRLSKMTFAQGKDSLLYVVFPPIDSKKEWKLGVYNGEKWKIIDCPIGAFSKIKRIGLVYFSDDHVLNIHSNEGIFRYTP